jgi:Holliday junction resolvase RusA-like endonuclease
VELEGQVIFSAAFERRPKSVQADKGNLAQYKRELQGLAKGAYFGEVVNEGPLYSRVIWFHRKTETMDVDNIVKPVLDALEGVVYSNDFLIIQSLATRIDVSSGEFELVDQGLPGVSYEGLVRLLGSGVDDILYIEIGLNRDLEIVNAHSLKVDASSVLD